MADRTADSQSFLRELETKLGTAADKSRRRRAASDFRPVAAASRINPKLNGLLNPSLHADRPFLPN